MTAKSICVVGLGYIGLPTAVVFANSEKNVVGVDTNPDVVESLNASKIHIEEPGLQDQLTKVIKEKKFKAQTQPAHADVYILAVPTPNGENNAPVLDYVRSAAESIVPYLKPGNLVILESTSPPGTTIGLIPILESTGLKVGEDILLAHSPERVLPGRILIELVENDRVIGGHTPEAAQAARDLYATFVTGQIHMTDATTAEMAKLMENTYRDVNIALANELSKIGQRVGIDIHEAISLANYHPRVNILKPGPGVGGHCIAVDPWFIVDAAPEEATLIRTARVVNDSQPDYVIDILKRATSEIESPVVAVLGLAYKPDVDDLRESPSVEIAKKLMEMKYETRLHDAHAKSGSLGLTLQPTLHDALDGADVILILTDHSDYKSLTPQSPEISGMRRNVIIDTRNSIDPAHWTAGGFEVYRLGAGTVSTIPKGDANT